MLRLTRRYSHTSGVVSILGEAIEEPTFDQIATFANRFCPATVGALRSRICLTFTQRLTPRSATLRHRASNCHSTWGHRFRSLVFPLQAHCLSVLLMERSWMTAAMQISIGRTSVSSLKARNRPALQCPGSDPLAFNVHLASAKPPGAFATKCAGRLRPTDRGDTPCRVLPSASNPRCRFFR